MIKVKSDHEIQCMKEAGEITALARKEAGKAIEVGITTAEIAEIAYKVITKAGAKASFYKYNGFPGYICCSINDEIIHGIPGKRKVRDGDIVKLDVGAYYRGYHGDCAASYPAGNVSADALKLIEVTRQSFFEGLKFARAGYRVSDISHAIQEYNEKHGYSLVREFVGHGIGSDLHEAPEVPNFVKTGYRGPRLVKGMTIAIEPMVNIGGREIKQLSDGWTVVTQDGSFSSHYENTVLITDGDPVILTAEPDGKHE